MKREDKLFADIYGCDDTKKLFRMVLESNHTCSILLTGPPVSAKTLFLQSLMKLKDSHFIDCSSASKSGIVDYIFENKPRYLLLDELDKLSRKDQTSLLNLIETGIVTETKYNKTRWMEIKTSVFATSNGLEKIILPLQSRFFIVKLQAYTYAQFYEITVKLLTSKKLDQITQTNMITSAWREMEIELDKVPPGSEYDISRKKWAYRMFNDIEWLCFLINEKFISDKKILRQLEPTLIGYYEDTFLKYVSKDEKVAKRYPEFIKLYQAIKQQSR